MDPLLLEAYSTVISAVPFVVGAYILIWVALAVFVGASYIKARRIQKELDALKSSLEHLKEDKSKRA